jgi:hypothetical protein
MSRENPRKVTVEDLIRLKRAERPPQEFWAQYDAQMRAKQLAAIVVRRPWWDGAAHVLARLTRYSLPVGAAAAVTLTWIGVRHLQAPSRVSSESLSRPVAAAAAPKADPVALPAAVAAPVARVAEEQSRSEVVAATTSHVTQVPADVATPAPTHNPFADTTPVVSLASYRESLSALQVPARSVFGTDREFESVVTPLPKASDSEPLARLDPSAERRARLLAPALPAYTAGSRAVATNWSKSKADDRIYESMDLSGSSERVVAGFRF